MPQVSSEVKRTLSRKKKIIFTAIIAFITFLFCFLLYFGFIYLRSIKFHDKQVRWIGSSYQADKDYGYFPKPNSVAFYLFKTGEKVPVLFDRNGFRVPERRLRIDRGYKTKILFLGCSFTHGYGVPAEKTFAHLAAKELNARELNAGISGGGFSQMVMRARKEIPRFKPKYVVAQYSNWLARRDTRLYKPTDYGKTPTPYFYESNNKILIHPPAFTTINFDVPIAKYSRKGLLPFTWHVGMPLYLHDDYFVLVTSLKRLLGILPKPVQSKEAIVRFAYKEIDRVCRANGAQMIILKLYSNVTNKEPDEIEMLGYPVIDTFEPLASRLPARTKKAWKKEFRFMRGNPPRLVDNHPNAKAHRIIAQTIVEGIRAITGRRRTVE